MAKWKKEIYELCEGFCFTKKEMVSIVREAEKCFKDNFTDEQKYNVTQRKVMSAYNRKYAF